MTNDIRATLQRKADGLRALLDAQLKDLAQLEQAKRDRERRDEEIKDNQRRLARERREKLIEAENYAADMTRTNGIFARFAAADAAGDREHCAIIAEAVGALFPRFTGPEDERRDPPRYAAMSWDARWLTLGAFLGIDAVRDQFPHLSVFDSDPDNDIYIYEHNGPADLELWRRQLPKIRRHLDAAYSSPGEYTVDLWRDASHVIVRRHEPLPQNLALDPAWLAPGEVLLGLDPTDQAPVRVPFAAWTHTLLCGASGTGKSNAIHVLLASLFNSLDLISAVYLVDGKDGVGLARYAGRDPKVSVLWELDEFAALLDRLSVVMTERNIAQRLAGIDNATDGFIIVLIDELATFVAPPYGADKEQKKAHGEMLGRLIALARRGRSVGIRLICTVQEPTEESLPVAVRNNLATVIAFALPIVQHAVAVFPDIASLPADPRTLPLGRAIYQNRLTGKTRLVQFPRMTAPGAPVTSRTTAPDPTTNSVTVAVATTSPPPPLSAPPVCKLHYAALIAGAPRKTTP